ncbi:hypothetical protein OEA41_000023 [Lepraria neglecta]|uniref:Uncharacterized protein n=1 Tax=Lepraria neglecta TaxID=209136 RepID=A0AAD9ZGC9_9LECA|nr:hypothetical protein OEA41_000023 [Lepraria neglecta]
MAIQLERLIVSKVIQDIESRLPLLEPNGGIGASLTLGGYNTSRFTPNDISFSFAPTAVSFLIVDYKYSNFLISQATFDQSTPTYIVPISSTDTTGTAPSNPTLTGSLRAKSTGNSFYGNGTGAIAGIAIAVVLIASLISVYFVRRMCRKKYDRKAGLPGDEPKVAPGILDMQKYDFSEDPEVRFKKSTTIIVAPTENPITPRSEMEGIESFGPNAIRPYSRIIELPGSPTTRSDFLSPELFSRSEAPSLSAEKLRSELLTPESIYSNSELPNPDPSHELASPSISAASSGYPSPSFDGRYLVFRSLLLIQRPTIERYGSSGSKTGLIRDGMPHRPTFYRRYHSDESDILSLQSGLSNLRIGSSNSESGFIHNNRPSSTSPTGVMYFEPLIQFE